MRSFLRLGLLLAPVLVVSGCQACVADSSDPQDLSTSHSPPSGSINRFRPRPMTPAGRLMLRDSGAGDE